MDTKLMDQMSKKYEQRENHRALIVDYLNVFHGVLKDAKLCRHLLLAPHIAEENNGNRLSFVGYLKKLLMSRDTTQQLKAVKGILSALIGCRSSEKSLHLKEEKCIMAKLLDNDFVEFMCEALPCPMASYADELMQAIFGCLALLSGEDQFFQHFHAVYALESVLRALHFVCEALTTGEKSLRIEFQTLSSGLALVAIIMEGSVNKSDILESGYKTVEGSSVLERLHVLITKSLTFENPSIKWKSGLVVRSLLNFWHLGKYFNQQMEKVQETLYKKKSYSPMNGINQGGQIEEVKEVKRRMSYYHKGVQLIQTESTVHRSAIFSVQENGLCHDNQDEPEPSLAKEVNLVLGLIEQSIKELVKFINDLLKSDISLDPRLMNQFLLLIFQIGKNSLRMLPHKMDLDIFEEKLSAETKRQDLTDIKRSPWKEIFYAISQPIGGQCATLLVEMEFNKHTWKVYKECLICLELLYQKAKDLCAPLSHSLASKGYLTLLTYLITYEDQRIFENPLPDVAVPFLMPLVCFMKNIKKISGIGSNTESIPSPLLKALWFTFATSYLSNECPKDPKIEDATHILMSCIYDYHVAHNNNGIKDIFTYHPAILLWAFSSPVKKQWIQYHVVFMWLEGCDTSKSCKVLEKLLASNQESLICLLSVAETGQREVMECTLRTIWNFLQHVEVSKQKEISSSLWEIFLYVVKRFNAIEDDLKRERRAINIACLMQLTLASSQKEPNASTVLRLSCLLNSTLSLKPSSSKDIHTKKSHCLLYLSGLQMLHFLLHVSLLNEDTRVASAILSHSGQLRRLEWASNLCTLGNQNQSKEILQNQETCMTVNYFVEDLNSFAFLILSSILQVNPYSQSAAGQVCLNPWHMLKAITSNHRDHCCSSVKLLNTLIQVHIKRPNLIPGTFVQIAHEETVIFANAAFVRILYLQFLMLCARVPLGDSSDCWEFLSHALQLPNKNLTSHLSKLPWNHSLLHAYLLTTGETESALMNESTNRKCFGITKPFLHFLSVWLSFYSQHGQKEQKHYRRTHGRMEPKSIGCIMFRKVLNALAKALANEKCEASDSVECKNLEDKYALVEKVIKLVLQHEGDIPNEVSMALKKTLLTISNNFSKN